VNDDKFKEAMDVAVQITAMTNKFVAIDCSYMSHGAIDKATLNYRYNVEDRLTGTAHTIHEVAAILTDHLNDLIRYKV